MAENEEFPVHKCVFEGDIKKLNSLIKTHDLTRKDHQGNTALHLAVILGRKECVQLLLSHNVPITVKNLAGWSALSEAISYGDRQTITLLLKKLQQQAREEMEEKIPNLIAALQRMGDFYVEIKWDFQSWVPLVSRILPSDICKIHKCGAAIRMDTTLFDFNDRSWERGDISFIFNGDQKPNKSLMVLDNKSKLFRRFGFILYDRETEDEIEDEVDMLMSQDIINVQMSTKEITFSKEQTGWIFKDDRKEMVGTFHADFYQMNGIVLESRKRREHLRKEDLQKNKEITKSLTKGSFQCLLNEELPPRRASLHPPAKTDLTWEKYCEFPPGASLPLGRSIVCKETSKAFKATVAMCQDFPLTVDMLLNVLEVITPFKHFNKLKEFVLMKLPPGFPVKIEIPILPTVTAKITFQEFDFKNDIDPRLFEVPLDYLEDPSRFPDL